MTCKNGSNNVNVQMISDKPKEKKRYPILVVRWLDSRNIPMVILDLAHDNN